MVSDSSARSESKCGYRHRIRGVQSALNYSPIVLNNRLFQLPLRVKVTIWICRKGDLMDSVVFIRRFVVIGRLAV